MEGCHRGQRSEPAVGLPPVDKAVDSLMTVNDSAPSRGGIGAAFSFDTFFRKLRDKQADSVSLPYFIGEGDRRFAAVEGLRDSAVGQSPTMRRQPRRAQARHPTPNPFRSKP